MGRKKTKLKMEEELKRRSRIQFVKKVGVPLSPGGPGSPMPGSPGSPLDPGKPGKPGCPG